MLSISAATLLACGSSGGKSPSQPAGTLVINPASAQTVFAGTQPNLTYTATLTGATGAITWSLSPASPGGGALSATTGTTVTYNPPASVASDTTVTLTATAGGLTTPVTITVQVPPVTPNLSVSPSPAGPFTAGGAGVTFTATQLNASNTITWSLSAPVGSLSATTGTSTIYTPPAGVPQNTVVTLTATAGLLTATSTFTVQPGTPGLTVSPTLNAAGNVALSVPTTFTATLLNSTATINWTLAPATGRGSLSAASGTTVVYTPPTVTGSVGGVTLTATAGALSKTIPIVVDPPTVAATTVKTLLQDFTVDNFTGGTFTEAPFAVAAGHAAAHDATHDLGSTKVSFTSATNDQFAGVVATPAAPLDLSTADVLALDVGFDVANANTQTFTRVQVLFWSNATDFFVAPGAGFMSTIAKPGRIAIPIKRTSLVVGAGSVGTPTWSSIQKIEIRFISVDGIGSNQAMFIYNLWRIDSVKPKVVLTFNGSNVSINNVAAPALAAAGFLGTLNLGGNVVGTGGHMTLAQVQGLFAAGWDVGNLTFTNTALTQMGAITCTAGVATFTAGDPADTLVNVNVAGTVTISGAEQLVLNGSQTVASRPNAASFTFNVAGGACPFIPVIPPSTPGPAPGFISIPRLADGAITLAVQGELDFANTNSIARGHDHFAYPQTYFDDHVIGLLQALNIKTATVGGNKGPLEDYSTPTFTGILDPFHIPSVPVTVHVDLALPHATAAELLGIVDAAVAKGSSLHLFVNNLVTASPATTDFLSSEFQLLVTGLKTRSDAGQLNVVTATQWYAGQ